jgi:D-arabinose 1-dehydrogenase-like Zn-dependent alcohol dehydrogenase
MKIPAEVKPALWGAVCGAGALAILGFTWGGWMTASSAAIQANQRASEAVVTALAPICADNFRRDEASVTRLVELKQVSTWEQAGFIQKGGWAKMPGIEAADTTMSRACATLILSDKVAEKN